MQDSNQFRRGVSRRRLTFLMVCLLGLTSACGYQVVGSAPAGADRPQATIAIPPFENRSMEVGLETIFANDLLRAFGDGGSVRAKPGDEGADYLLLGTIKKLEHSSTAYLDIDRSLVRRVTVTVEITLKDFRQNKVIWKSTEMIKADYVAENYYSIGEANRTQGIRQASARLAQRVYDKINVLL
ncbi:LPS assembly lipoprotein LptE [Desulfobacca acetoxidans]|uniref:Lipoprotein n=1 Tax=Desulfobacca acetoxidans (strain ATCC 700848 / DSM 11109 / ASRB2) TaxID=880072 RepID=F2ND08_DESAR|nr:LPS assembly lipoprotein LptE [Desulfobacca acetoxidans]AEB09582.1 hypothetical protein Desac_1742 [Desulfobacca acetoxidans DSM 11109]